MKSILITTYFAGLLSSALIPYFDQSKEAEFQIMESEELKARAFEILDTKCNVCHRKKNPFMVFSLRNMEKRATKIKTQVFIKKRMPKGTEIKLSQAETDTLKKWINTLSSTNRNGNIS